MPEWLEIYVVTGMIFLALNLLIVKSPDAGWVAVVLASMLYVAMWPLWLLFLLIVVVRKLTHASE